MTLKGEIQQLLAGFSVPEHIARIIAESHQALEGSGIARGIAVGDQAPDFELEDSAGHSVRLYEQLRRGPAVVSFFRVAWCPVCNLQLVAFQRALPEITTLGAEILAVHPESGQLVEDPPDGFHILADTSQRVIHDYRLEFTVSADVRRIYPLVFGVDVSKKNANGGWTLPVPGTFVVGQDRIVKRRHVRADFSLRMEPSEVIEALTQLRDERERAAN
ncbi:MAG: peroxiredoxin-like family protein [Acidobacteria bacterium]|nr:peroxiredoxin-like family protein [Acidobacteriota bacterium]MDA1233402.1 peroxiredoxin-like family protein [Acidobacteriota bacterium]